MRIGVKMICKMLSNHVYVGTTGQYRLCCVSQEPTNKETIFTHRPEEWLASETVTKTKELLAQGVWPSSCSTCKNHEEQGIQSRRQCKDFYGPGVTHLDLRFGNSCNLKCISCYGGASSSIANEDKEMIQRGIIPISSQTFDNYNWYDEKVLSYFDNFPLSEVYLTGGEPMMVKHLPDLLARLDPSVTIRFNTNGTIFNPKINTLLKKFKKVIMSISLDAVGAKIEYIRYGSIWKEIEHNVSYYIDNYKTDITPCISVLNALYYDEIVEWAAVKKTKIYDNLLVMPEWLNLRNAPQSLKDQITYFESWKSQSADPKQLEVFRSEIARRDSFRNVRIKDYLPEVAAAYGID